MISQNPYSNCMSARLYYYDFLNEKAEESIPESTLNHITNCSECQAEIGRLEILLANADERLEDQQSRRNSAITTLLKFHFAHVDEPVTCSTIKPFLASLADPVLQIRIPTPITKHINECWNCHDDLLTLQDLHLTHKQLCRLGQLLAQKPTEETVSCSQARQAIPAVASMVFRRTNAEVLKHLSMCPACRKALFQHREELRQKLPDCVKEQGKIPCEAVSPSDIYDYAFPYGIDPADDEYAEFREPLASHLGGCPTCLAKVQELQKTIYRIAERPESDVVTVYHVEEPAAARGESGADHARQGKIINFTVRLRKTVTSPKIKPWIRTSAAAAAVILIGLVLISNEPTVEAVSLDQMSRAIENVRNLHISTFRTDKAEPTQETWFSRSLDFHLSKNTTEIVLSDFTNKLQTVRQLGSDKTVKKDLPDGMFVAIERNLAGYLNIIPQVPIPDTRKQSNWRRVSVDDGLEMDNKNRVAYDLSYTETTFGGSPVHYKRRYFFDSETDIPNEVRILKKSSDTGKYTLQSKILIKRLSDNEMKDAVKNAFP